MKPEDVKTLSDLIELALDDIEIQRVKGNFRWRPEMWLNEDVIKDNICEGCLCSGMLFEQRNEIKTILEQYGSPIFVSDFVGKKIGAFSMPRALMALNKVREGDIAPALFELKLIEECEMPAYSEIWDEQMPDDYKPLALALRKIIIALRKENL